MNTCEQYVLEFPTGRDFLVPRDKGTMGQAQNLAVRPACHGTGRDGPGRYFDILPWERILTACPEMCWDRGVCPGIFAAALVPGQRDGRQANLFLSRDKGTAGQANFFVPGPRDNGTSIPLETLVHTYNNDVIMIIDK